MSDLWGIHDSHDLFYREPFGAVETGTEITIRIKIYAPFTVTSAVLRLWQDGLGERKIEMVKEGQEEAAQIFIGKVSTPSSTGLLWYYFIVRGRGKTYYYGSNPDGLGGLGLFTEYPPYSYQITLYKKNFKTPEWFKDSVMYQIFVDRFFDGSENKELLKLKDNCIIHESWDEQPLYKPDPVAKEVLCNDFFGGNLPGILKKLPYLKELGVDVLYLNPVFEAYSNHKYDIGDYKKIDPAFGDLDVLQKLCKSADAMGIRILFDGVFSHTGSDSVYFNEKGRYPEIGAYQSKDSPYFRWYRFIKYPDEYESWWGIKTLPNVNEMENSYMDFIIEDEDSVSKYWIKRGTKGWRLDVVDELPDEFLKKFRKSVKSADSEAVIIGEVWEDASRKVSYGKRREYILGEELDSVMNYPLREMLFKFLLGEWDAWQMNRGILSLFENYPAHIFYSLMNMLGTHDVARAKTILSGAPPDHILTKDEQAGYSMSPEMEDLANKRLKIACLFQMTFPGVPCIYYGDEAGLSGYRDPFNRGTYPWGREDNNLLSWHKKMIALRKKTDALRTGEFIPVFVDIDVYGFVRMIKGGKDVFGNDREDGFVVVLINRSQYEAHSVSLDMERWGVNRLRCVFDERSTFLAYNGRIEVEIPALGTRVLQNHGDGSIDGTVPSMGRFF